MGRLLQSVVYGLLFTSIGWFGLVYNEGSSLWRRFLTSSSSPSSSSSLLKKKNQPQQQHDNGNSNNDYSLRDGMRVLALGASRTWGAKLPDRTTQAYPQLLSPHNATNMGIRATGPDYPSLCLYTLLHNDDNNESELPYNVIVLEFYLDADEHLVRLAKRLRLRYPQALIVVLRLWGPMALEHVPSHTPQQGLQHVLQQEGLVFGTPEAADYLQQHTHPSDWKFVEYPLSKHYQQLAMDAVGGVLWELPIPTNPLEAILTTAHLFDADMVHLSVAGHQRVAQGIQQLVQQHYYDSFSSPQQQQQQQQSTIPNGRPLVRPWKLLDHCESWYETGQLSSSSQLSYSASVRMTEFNPDAHKWALEMVPTTNDDDNPSSSSSFLRVHNPLPHTAQLYIRFLKTTPPPGLYPTTRISYTLTNTTTTHSTILEPTGSNPYTHVHVNRVASLGPIPPGSTKLVLEPLQDHQPFPFRITGIVISPTNQHIQQETQHILLGRH